jgi:hypothetical protein
MNLEGSNPDTKQETKEDDRPAMDLEKLGNSDMEAIQEIARLFVDEKNRREITPEISNIIQHKLERELCSKMIYQTMTQHDQNLQRAIAIEDKQIETIDIFTNSISDHTSKDIDIEGWFELVHLIEDDRDLKIRSFRRSFAVIAEKLVKLCSPKSGPFP